MGSIGEIIWTEVNRVLLFNALYGDLDKLDWTADFFNSCTLISSSKCAEKIILKQKTACKPSLHKCKVF